MLWIRLALRNTLRNRRRTALTAATILLATAMLTITLAWLEGVFGTMIRDFTAASGGIRVVDADWAAREALAPMYENIAETDPVVAAIRAVLGVTGVEPRITMGVAITATDEIGESFAQVVGATDSYYRERLDGPGNLVHGEWLSGAGKEVVLGRKTAERAEATVGMKVLMLGQTQYGSMSPLGAKVVGIVSGNALVDNQAFITLEDARYLADIPDGALEVLVYGPSERQSDLAPLVAAIGAVPALQGLDVSGWYARDPWASTLTVLGGVRGFIQALIVFIAALAIFNTMTMAVMERSGEIGVMRAMGLTRVGALGLFTVEALSIGLFGALAGGGLGAAIGSLLERTGISLKQDVVERMGATLPMKATFYADLTPEIVVNAMALGLFIALLGAILPALRAASIQPVAAMHARR